jgi:hypothetical protein
MHMEFIDPPWSYQCGIVSPPPPDFFEGGSAFYLGSKALASQDNLGVEIDGLMQALGAGFVKR